MRAAIVSLLVLAVLLVAADRGGAWLAGRAASDAVAQHAPFRERPSVTVHGVPFLTQAVGGTYHDVEVRGGGLVLGSVSGASLDAHLRGVHLPLGSLVHRSVTRLPCDAVDGTVTLPYAELARLSGVPGLVLTGSGDDLGATAALTVPVLGTLRVSGAAALAVVDGALRLRVTRLQVLGVSVPSGLLATLQDQLNVPIPLPQLPYGLHVDGVRPAANGVQVHGSGSKVVLGTG